MRNFASTLVKFSKLSHIQTTIWRPPKMAPPPPRTAGSAGPFVTPLCLTQLLSHIEFIYKSLNGNNEVDVIYLDYSKAFDKVDNKVLLEQLKRYGIEGKVLCWIEQFLTNRTQTVQVEGVLSSPQAFG